MQIKLSIVAFLAVVTAISAHTASAQTVNVGETVNWHLKEGTNNQETIDSDSHHYWWAIWVNPGSYEAKAFARDVSSPYERIEIPKGTVKLICAKNLEVFVSKWSQNNRDIQYGSATKIVGCDPH
ncbi:hypothetical protein ACTL6U_20000 [Rhodovibrionaceae bacterium A322]